MSSVAALLTPWNLAAIREDLLMPTFFTVNMSLLTPITCFKTCGELKAMTSTTDL